MALETLLLSLALGAIAPPPGDRPGGGKICVPSEDGRGWQCGTREQPPPERGLPERAPAEAPVPPPFLADPYRDTTQPAEVSAVSEAEPPAPEALPDEPAAVEPEPEAVDATAEAGALVEPVEPVEAAAADEPAAVTAEEAPAAATSSESAASTGSEPPLMLARPLRDRPVPLAPVAAPRPATSPRVPATTADDEPATTADAPQVEAAATAETLPAEAEPAPAATESIADVEPAAAAPVHPAAPPRDAEAFLAQAQSGYTVQLARAESSAAFGELVAALGIDPDASYALPLAGTDRTWWVLVWSSFPDAAAARAAIATLPSVATPGGAVPRRIAPLHDELRRGRGAAR